MTRTKLAATAALCAIAGSAVAEVEEEMRAAGAKAEVIVYPGAKHAFTNPYAGKIGTEAHAYDADADRRSFEAAVKFLREVFGT
jgi:dienelactone hydrolase